MDKHIEKLRHNNKVEILINKEESKDGFWVTSRAQIDAIIGGCQVCHLGLSLNNEPYVVPVCFGYDGTVLYFHSSESGKKIDYLEANSRVAFQMEREAKFVACGPEPCGPPPMNQVN